ncbi:MAG: hypothetical protein R3C49_23660 [Planctomycetaceae bacterium]
MLKKHGGIQSLFTLIAATGTALLVVDRPAGHCVLMILAAVFWAAMMNTLRVASSSSCLSKRELTYLKELPTRSLVLPLFLMAVWMCVSTDSLLQLILPGSGGRMKTD